MSAFANETVLTVHHWNDTLFSFTTTREPEGCGSGPGIS